MSALTRLAAGRRAISVPKTGMGMSIQNPTAGGKVKAATISSSYNAPGSPMYQQWDGSIAVRNYYLGHTFVHRCIRTKADTIAGLPFKVGPDPDDPSTTVDGSALGKLLGPASPQEPGGPNQNTTARALWAWSIVQYECTGKIAWEQILDPQTKDIFALYPLVSSAVQGIPTAPGAQDYWASFVYNTPFGDTSLSSDRVFYAWRPSAEDWRQAESPLQAAHLPIETAIACDRYMWNLLKNGMVASKIVIAPPFEDEGDRRAWEEQFFSEFSGFDNAGKTIFAEAENDYDDTSGKMVDSANVQVIDLAMKSVDAQLLQMVQQAKIDITIALGVPESLIGNASQRTYANSDAEYRNFWTLTVVPEITDLQDYVNVNLAPKLDKNVVGWFDLSQVAALQPPSIFMPPALTDAISAGVVTAEQAANLLDIPTTSATGEDTETAPIGEESSATTNTGSGSRALRLHGQGSPRLDAPEGWRFRYRPVTSHTLSVGNAGWGLVRDPRQHIRLAGKRAETPDLAIDVTATVSQIRRRRQVGSQVAEIEAAVAEAEGQRDGVCTGPGPCDTTPIGAGKNWVNKVGGLPLYIRAIAQALLRSGHSESDAVSLAVGTVKNWASGQGKVTPATRARAAAAIAEWEKKKAEAHGSRSFHFDPDELRGPDGKWTIGSSAKQASTALGIHHAKASSNPAFSKEADRLSSASTEHTEGTLQSAFSSSIDHAKTAQKKGNEAAAAKHLAAATVAEAELRARGITPKYGNVELAGKRDFVGESSSSGDLLPVGPSKKQAAAVMATEQHRFAGSDLMNCTKCAKPINDPIHAHEGKRHRGPNHTPVQTGHVAGNLHRRRVAQKAAFNSDADQIEPQMADAMTQLFEQQKAATVSRLQGKRGKQMLRSAPPADEQPEPASPATPAPDAAAIFDVGFWANKTAQVAQPAYSAAADLSKARVMTQLGNPETDDSNSLGQVVSILHQRANRMAQDVTDTTFSQIQDQLAQGTQAGEGIPDLTKRVQGVFDTASKSRAQTIARTETIGALNESANTYAKHLPRTVVGRKEWMAHKDSRTRPMHRMADGQTVPIDQPFHVGGSLMEHPGDPTAPPDEVCNCFPGDALVDAPGIIGATRRWYVGPMVSFRARSGRVVRATPNHPILTTDGWKAAETLRRGDHLIQASLLEGASVTRGQKDHMPSTFSEVIDPIQQFGSASRQVVHAVDFHGDGCGDGLESYVDVVRADRYLGPRNQSVIDGILSKFGLSLTDPGRSPHVGTSPSDGSSADFDRVVLSTSPPILSEPSQSQSLLGSRLSHASEHGSRSTATLDPVLVQDAVDDGPADLVPLGESLLTLTAGIAIDEIITVDVGSFSGHVYNLQTATGWYVANGIVAHNCRCSVAYLPATTTASLKEAA